MIYSISYTVLRLSRRKTGRTANLFFNNARIGFDSYRRFTSKILEDKVPNENLKNDRLQESDALNDKEGYINRLKDDDSVNHCVNDECNDNVTERSNVPDPAEINLLLEKLDYNRNRGIKRTVPTTRDKYNAKQTTTVMGTYNHSFDNVTMTVNKNQPAILNEHNSENITVLGKYNHNLDDALYDINEKPLGPLDVCSEDLSHIEPSVTPTYNFARFANDSITIQQLVKLGVELYKLEADRDVTEMILSLDFDKDIKPYIRFLNDCGVPPENLGKFITKNPKIFKEDIDDLHTRIRYLMAHHFSPDMVQQIINSNPFWLSFKVQDIDRRLGYFQHNFKLKGHKVRLLAVKCPKLITYQMKHLMENTFAVREEMGFDPKQTQLLLMRVPRVWMHARSKIMNSFDYAHNVMKLSHEILVKQPQILTCRKIRLQQRHLFLTELKKTQYDPTKPLYVSPLDIVSGNDLEFCNNVAKASINTYNIFLKSI